MELENKDLTKEQDTVISRVSNPKGPVIMF